MVNALLEVLREERQKNDTYQAQLLTAHQQASQTRIHQVVEQSRSREAELRHVLLTDAQEREERLLREIRRFHGKGT